MSRLATLMKKFSQDESGAALVEYAVIFAVLIAGSVVAIGGIAPQIVEIFNEVVAQIDPLNVPPGG